ncbi:hypothetical protein OIU78_021305 [Salix suchowensis]|nr:hypothetical protein OIU78_021305 [Salix suchowensis]
MASAVFIVGVLGNIISGLVYLSPLKTFWRIVKKRSTENFSSIPYILTLMNAILWIYYGITKPDSFLIATINGFGAATQIVYILIFLVFISPRMRARTALLVGLLDVGLAAAAILFTHFHVTRRSMKTVITTKSVEFMPFLLTFSTLLNGGFWTLYALLAKDFLVGVPNGIGFLLGIAQLILYGIYHRYRPLKKVTDNLEDGLQNDPLIPASDFVS